MYNFLNLVKSFVYHFLSWSDGLDMRVNQKTFLETILRSWLPLFRVYWTIDLFRRSALTAYLILFQEKFLNEYRTGGVGSVKSMSNAVLFIEV